MPGGRLTREEREHIAARLAEGLGYAEIARQLGRPTSTVSREVARNIGRNGYRPAQAQRVTRQRARRAKHTKPVESPTSPEVPADVTDGLVAVVAAKGLPPMASRVCVCLFLSDSGSLTAAELVRLLRVSPASVSTAIGYLENQGIVTRERDTRERRERYAIGDDVWYRTWMSSAQHHAAWADAARDAAARLDGTPAGVRLTKMALFFDHIVDYTNAAGERWLKLISEDMKD
ncbi:MarR family transcriptional regulator [Kibdelosporangium phytohabitans]|uniref:HTH arsR-type domain-containing protein n=1 Tax=Kibdelosporangium phytohabitans TaxID=860235 RepID=A0A0N9IEP8_9PSEU|nr:helix-turn-helix domain-containing protein [Kibdelosporangium phytohabitans]ALG13270.1 hypothetical protein AOZ06_46155 [Kibdelosporangium phytohabitans]MBE1465044.1 DNA-binding MarR family transcriptional regulator [Kibdelosporangium phytohabitans]